MLSCIDLLTPRPSLDIISVVTAVRNGSVTVLDTLKSVAAQSYSRKEHVIQDGGSTDGTQYLVIGQQLAHVHLQSIEDSGVYNAFNRGLGRAQGSIIGFIGADDIYEGRDVLAQVASAFVDPRVDMVFGDALVTHRDDLSKVRRHYRSGPFLGLESLRRGFMPAHTSMFVRRRLFDDVGNFDESFGVAGDFEWIVRLFATRSVKSLYIQRPLVRMRIGGLSSSGLKSAWKVTREFRRACAKNDVGTSYPRLLARFPNKLMEHVIRS